MTKLIRYVILAILVVCMSRPASAGIFDLFRIERGSVEVHKDDTHVDVEIGRHDDRYIRRYYRKKRKHKKHHRGLPPGLAKKRRLPPGLQKRLDVGQPLPPGLQGEPLPPDLENSLKKLPEDYVRVKVGGAVVILNQVTNIVIDIVRDLE